jgi:hypothetical protein
MMQFESVEISREDFLRWLGNDKERFDELPLLNSSHVKGDIALLWDRSVGRSDTQPIISVPSNELRDFFAFVSTYVTTFRPYTAFFRVVPTELVSAIEDRKPLRPDVTANTARLVAGASLGEASLHVQKASTTRLSTLTATISACLGQAVIAGYSTKLIDWFAAEWRLIHAVPKAGSREGQVLDEVPSIWKLIGQAVQDDKRGDTHATSQSDRVIINFIAEAVRHHGITKNTLSLLGDHPSFFVNPVKVLTLPREERINIFNEYVSQLENSHRDPMFGQFMSGLLLAIAGNGSFDLIRSAKPLIEKSPISIIWFGVCAGLFEESNILTTANCVGRRLIRDTQRIHSLFDTPVSDLSSFEYQLLSRDTTAISQINARSSDGLHIELLPNVATYLPRDTDGREDRAAGDIQILASSLQEIRSVLERVQRRLPYTGVTTQRDIFRGSDKPKGRSR